MTASLRRRGAFALAVFGIFSLLAAFIPGIASADDQSDNRGGNEDCPEGTVLLAKFNYGAGYVLESGGGVTIDPSADDEGGTWTSTSLVSHIVVKGGPGAYIASVNPAATSGSFTQVGLPLVGNENNPQTPGISNLKFCGPGGTTTTDQVTTTTTDQGTTTTTEQGTTTTTVQVTTTTTPAAGTFTVSKVVVGGTSGGSFTFTIVCEGGFNTTVEVAHGGSATVGPILLGDEDEVDCTVSETGIPAAPEGSSWEDTPDPQDITVGSGENGDVLFTNVLTGVLGQEVEAPQEEAPVVADLQVLPRTGASSIPLAAMGAASLLGGIGLARAGRRED